MSAGFFSAVVSWIDELVSSPDDGVPTHSPIEEKRACQAVSALEARLSDFRERVSEEFPHRADALALTDEVEKILCEQHGGLSAAEFMHKFCNNTLGDLSSHGDRMATGKLCRRWVVLEANTHNEFRGLHPTYSACNRNVVFGETEISSTVAFMRKWLGNQRDGSHFVDAEKQSYCSWTGI